MDSASDPSAFDRQCGRWFAVAVTGRAADVLTTAYGLRQPHVVERNAIVDGVLEAYSVLSGATIVSCAVLIALLVVTELGVNRCLRAGSPIFAIPVVRATGYLLPGAFWLLVAGHNLAVTGMGG